MQKQFLPIGLDFAKKDLRAAFLLSFLINTSDYYSQNDKDADGWFYCTADNLKERIGFTRADIQHAVTVLCAMNLLQTQKRGMPAKIYYRVNTDTAIYTNACLLENDKQVCTKTTNKFAENQQTSLHENDKQVCTNPANKFVEIQQTSLSENDSNKELINKELNNNNENKELNKEERADFANPLPLPDFSEEVGQISFLAAKLTKPENLSERVWGFFAALCKSKKKKFTKKGWGAATNKLVEGFSEFGETAMFEHLERWAESTTWTSPFFKGSAWKDAIRKSSPDAIIANDPRNLPKNNAKATMETFVRIKALYSSEIMGVGLVPKGGTDASEKEILKGLWAKLLAVTPNQPAEFEKELAIIETALKAERAQRANGKVTTQAKTFENWIKSKGWEKFPAKAPKIAPIAPKAPTAEQTPETPTIMQQREDFGLMNITPKYKVLGDAAERAKAYQGKAFVWDNSLPNYANGETFRKLTSISERVLIAQKIFDTRTFAEFITKQFGVDYADAEKLSEQLAYMIPETHKVIVTPQERAGFPVTDISKFLTTRSVNP